MKKKMMLANECRGLFDDIYASYRKAYPGEYSRVANSVLFAYAFQHVLALKEYQSVDWRAISRIPEVVHVEENGDIRYGTSITLPMASIPEVTWDMLEHFRASMRKEFSGIRRTCYLPFVIRLVLRAFILDGRGQLPEKEEENHE